MFRKIFSAMLVLSVAASFCACSSNDDINITFKRKTTQSTHQVTTEAETTEYQTEETTAVEQTTQAAENNTSEYTVTQQVNVRSNPDYNSDILGQLMYGETISVSSVENGWAVIDYNDTPGYVSVEYLNPLV